MPLTSRSVRILAGTICVSLSAAAALGQAEPMEGGPATPARAAPKPTTTKAPAANPNDDSQALAGPRVGPKPGEKTIVERAFDGSLSRLEVRPEQAAVDLLTLTPEQKQTVTKLFDDRSKAINGILYEHLDAFLAVQAARQGGAYKPGAQNNTERDQLAPKMRELRQAGLALVEPPLVDQVADKLPEDQVGEFRRLVAEYMTALEAANQRDMGGNGQGSFSRPGAASPDGPRGGPMPAQRLEMNLYIREIARALGARVQQRKEQTEALFKAIDATPEQQTQIEKILRDSAEKNGRGKRPTPEQRADTFRNIMDVLTPEQRQLAREQLRPGAER